MAPRRADLEERVRETVRAIAERAVAAGGDAEGMEVVDVEYGGGLLRVFLDKPDGISHEDCERVSRQLSATLDAEDAIPGARSYVLEVSSPGLDRRLVKREDFERFAGRKARLRVRPRPGENRRNYAGILEGVTEDRIRLRLADSGETVEIERERVERANLTPEW